MDCPRQTYGYDDEPLKSGSIDINDVSFAYRDDRLVLQDISLNVPARSFVAPWGIPVAVKVRWQACSWATTR